MGPLVNRRRHVVYRFDGPTPEPLPLSGQRRSLVLDPDVVRHYFGRSPDDRSRLRVSLRLLARGCIGTLIVDGDEWASVGWISHPGSMAPPHLTRQIIGRSVLWSFAAYTRPAFRRQGLLKATFRMRIALARQAVDDPNAVIHNDVSINNTKSRRAQLGAGLVPAGQLRWLRIRVPGVSLWTWGVWDVDAEHPPLAEPERDAGPGRAPVLTYR